ncbi:preprotein translocase subunit YajC [Planctomycetia bacterium]|nr:preprotein translocase subunit YajC [Planctomycetia bacterium]
MPQPSDLLPLFAQAADPAAEPGSDGFLRNLISALPVALITLLAYFLLFRPEQERRKKQQELFAGLKKNDRVVTSSGIYGTVAAVDRDADRVTLKVDDAGNVKIGVTLASIARVLGDEKPESRNGREDA